MGLSNKLLLAANIPREAITQWQGDVSFLLITNTATNRTYNYSPSLKRGTLSPLLETVKPGITIKNLSTMIPPDTMKMVTAQLAFDSIPTSGSPFSLYFEGLKKIIIHSTNGGEPYVIDNPQDYYKNGKYNLFSYALADWAYTNLTFGDTLDFTLGLEWDK